MRYRGDHKARTRARIVGAAAAAFRRDGISRTGVKAVMAECGLTVGGFYKHFRSKGELVRDAMEASLQRTLGLMAAPEAVEDGWLEQAVAAYLSRWHVEHPGEGCPLPSLTAELGRHDDETRDAFGLSLERLADGLQPVVPGADRQHAWGVIAIAVGGLMLARAVRDPALRTEILRACRAQAVKLPG